MNNVVFILVHGAWHDSRCWEQLAPLLCAAGHQVVTPDLPGHGNSELSPTKVHLKHYVQCIKDLVLASELPVVLVGHSLAGMVITEVAAELPTRIYRLVYLCAYLPTTGDSVFSLIARNRGHEPLSEIELAMEISDDKRTCCIAAESIAPLFYSQLPAAMAEPYVQRFGVQGSLPLAATVKFAPAALATLDRYYLGCTRDRVIPWHHQQRMLAAHTGIKVQQLNADHSPFFSCTADLAAQLLALSQG